MSVYADPSGTDPNAIDYDLFYTPELLGQECCGCYKILKWDQFAKDSSLKTGHKPLCNSCASSPCLTMEEHTHRLKESSLSSHGVARQRHEDQSEFRLTDEREGRRMHTADLLLKLHKLIPSLFVKEGGINGDLALYQVAETPQTKWGGKNYSYLGFVSYGNLSEYSLYQFDEVRDVMVREKQRGWRTTLLRCIKAGLITEEQADRVFGKPSGRASGVWYKQLYEYRNKNVPLP